MGLRSMKKVIESFWVTAKENNAIDNGTKETTQTDCYAINLVQYLFCSNLPNYI